MTKRVSFWRGLSICIFFVLTAAACNTTESLTKEELAVQNAADTQVAMVLFERDLDKAASYNVHKDGYVVIKFKNDVPSADYVGRRTSGARWFKIVAPTAAQKDSHPLLSCSDIETLLKTTLPRKDLERDEVIRQMEKRHRKRLASTQAQYRKQGLPIPEIVGAVNPAK